MPTILIVDDEPRIRQLIREHLQHAGFTCLEAGDGGEALAVLERDGADLAILDIMMPFMDGMACLRQMRTRGIATPVIMLTARGEEYDKLAGLEGGADDYVVKPFSPRELVARVRAVLSRTLPREREDPGRYTFGELSIDTASHSVKVAGQEVALTPKEFDLLVFLAGNRGLALSREKILQKVWTYDYYGEASVVLKDLLLLVALILGVFAILGAWLFSRWFTRPVTELSAAARQMAQGNYAVRVEAKSRDEVGRLAEDFNLMAGEVASASQLQRDLLANVSHDLRTPLTLIKGYAETVRDLTGGDAARRTEQLNIIVDETDRLSALVNSVLELSKVSSGAEKPQPVQFDLTQLCEEVAERYSAVCERDGHTLRLETDGPCPVLADPAMLERVLHNFLGNAMHHLGPDGVFILRAARAGNGTVRLEVEDHGPGIPPDELPHLFDRYYRSRSDAGRPGTGLGLSISQAILRSHGFRFGVQSDLGKGSVFWFELPLAGPEAPAQ